MPENTPERSEEEIDVVEKAGDAVEITLGKGITVADPGITGDSVTVDGNIVTITAGGMDRGGRR